MRTSVHIKVRRLCPSLGFRQDVSRGVDVPIVGISAMPTDVSTNGERLLNDLATVGASLTRKVWRYFDNSHPGAFSLEHEQVLEGTPTRVGNRLGKMVVLEHVGNSEVLDGDEGVSINVVPRRFMRVVLTLAGDLEMLPRCLLRSLTTTVGAFLPPRHLALRYAEPLLSGLKTTRVFDRVPIGISNEVLESDVQSNSGTVPLLWRVSKITHDKDVPVIVGSKYKVSGLRGTFKRTVLLDLETASEFLGYSQLPGAGIKVHVPACSILAKLNRVPTVGGLEAWKANLTSKFLAVKEPLERLIQPVGKGLYRGLRDMLAAPPFERVHEVVLVDELPSLIIVSLDRLQHFVVQTAAFRQRRKESTTLNTVWIKSILESLIHIPIVPRIRESVARIFTSPLKRAALNPGFL